MDISAKIEHLKPCRKAKSWLESQSFSSPQQAWDECQNGSWMLWMIGKQIKSKPWSDDRKRLLACALDCAATVSNLWSQKTTDAVAVLRRWVSGTATVNEAHAAADAAYSAYAAADAAASAAASVAYAAAYSAYAAADAAVEKQCADIVRRHYPVPPAI